MSPPIRRGDGTGVEPNGFAEVRTGDGRVLFDAIPDYYTHQWKLDEGSGSTAADAVGSATASINGADWVSGSYIGSYALEANSSNNDYVDLTPLGNFGSTMGGGFAWAFTFNTTETGVMFGAAEGNQEFLFGTDAQSYGTDGALNFQIDDDGNSNTEAINTDDNTFDDGSKYRCVFQTGDATADSHEIWINGSQENTSIGASQGGSTYADFSNSIFMFAYNDKGSTNSYISATIDNVIITDRKLTQSEIQDDYNNQPWV